MFGRIKSFLSRFWEKITAKGGPENISWSLLFLSIGAIWAIVRTVIAIVSFVR